MFENLKAFIRDMNDKGVPMPLLRVKGQASLSATLVAASFMMWQLAVVGKWSGALGGIDPQQCLNMFLATASLYWGRKFQKDDKGVVLIEEKSK